MLIVAATERELEHVRRFDTFRCGVGPVEAALQTARALAERKPDAVIHIGIAGARAIEPLSLVLGSEAVYEDALGPLVAARVAPDAALARVRPRGAPGGACPPDRNERACGRNA